MVTNAIVALVTLGLLYSYKERCYKLAAVPSVVCDIADNKRSVILHADDVQF